MKIKCKNSACSATCTVDMKCDINEKYLTFIPCIALKSLTVEWEKIECPECESELDDNGRCKANCTKVGM